MDVPAERRNHPNVKIVNPVSARLCSAKSDKSKAIELCDKSKDVLAINKVDVFGSATKLENLLLYRVLCLVGKGTQTYGKFQILRRVERIEIKCRSLHQARYKYPFDTQKQLGMAPLTIE